MLAAMKAVITDFVCPAAKVFTRELEVSINAQIQYMVDCKPQSMAMGNVIKWLKMHVGSTRLLAKPEEGTPDAARGGGGGGVDTAKLALEELAIEATGSSAMLAQKLERREADGELERCKAEARAKEQ